MLLLPLSRECRKLRGSLERATRAAIAAASATSPSPSSFSSTSSSSRTRVLRVVSFGDDLVPYSEALALQEAVAEARRRGSLTSDVALSLQHAPVYTLGKRARPHADLRSSPEALGLLRRGGGGAGEATSELVVESPRGGQATWHGPGQAVLYPVLLLRGEGGARARAGAPAARASGRPRPAVGVREYVERLEETLVSVSTRAGVRGCVSGSAFGSPGAWVAVSEPPQSPDECDGGAAAAASAAKEKKLRKIGAVGVRVSRGVATHGVALNVRPDLRSFDAIVPCGDEGAEPTSIEAELERSGTTQTPSASRGTGADADDGRSSLDVVGIGLELAEELARRLGYEEGTEVVSVEGLKRELRVLGYDI